MISLIGWKSFNGYVGTKPVKFEILLTKKKYLRHSRERMIKQEHIIISSLVPNAFGNYYIMMMAWSNKTSEYNFKQAVMYPAFGTSQLKCGSKRRTSHPLSLIVTTEKLESYDAWISARNQGMNMINEIVSHKILSMMIDQDDEMKYKYITLMIWIRYGYHVVNRLTKFGHVRVTHPMRCSYTCVFTASYIGIYSDHLVTVPTC